MRKPGKTILAAVAAVLFSLSGAVSFCWAGDAPRVIEMTADKDNRFRLADGQKGPLRLKPGEKVTFRITSYFGGEKARDGSVHSFVVRKLRAQGWDVRLKEGVQEFTLTAPEPGEYMIECTVQCGPGHDDMNFKMVVQ